MRLGLCKQSLSFYLGKVKMDLLRSWIYGHERPNIFYSHEEDLNARISSGVTSQDGKRDKVPQQDMQYTDDGHNLHEEADPSKLEKLILRFVPLQPGDCLGCKLVGTSVMVASGIIVLTSATVGRKRNPSLTGKKLITYYMVCGSLFIGFQAAAVCRFFDLGLFGYLAKQQGKVIR